MNCDVEIRKVFLRQCRAVKLTAIFQGPGKRIYGTDGVGSFRDEDLGCSTRVKILGMDLQIFS